MIGRMRITRWRVVEVLICSIASCFQIRLESNRTIAYITTISWHNYIECVIFELMITRFVISLSANHYMRRAIGRKRFPIGGGGGGIVVG